MAASATLYSHVLPVTMSLHCGRTLHSQVRAMDSRPLWRVMATRQVTIYSTLVARSTSWVSASITQLAVQALPTKHGPHGPILYDLHLLLGAGESDEHRGAVVHQGKESLHTEQPQH